MRHNRHGKWRLLPFAMLLAGSAQAQTPVDALINMDNVSPSSPGTQLTTTILSNGTVGSWGGWSSIVGTGSSLTVGSHNSLCSLGTSVSIGGTTYNAASPSQSISLNDASNFTYAVGGIPGGHSKISVAGCITFGGVPNTTNLIDMVSIYGTLGGYAVIQLESGNCINIETNGNGTQHSGCITPTSNDPTYWCTMLVDPTNSISKLACYLPVAPYTQIGGTVSVVTQNSSQFGSVNKTYLGNAEEGTASGTSSTFENLMFDLTNASFPLGVGSSGSTPPPPPPPPATSACDVNGDGVVNVADVQLEVNMALGLVTPCPNADGCTVVQVQRVVNAALGGTCVAP